MIIFLYLINQKSNNLDIRNPKHLKLLHALTCKNVHIKNRLKNSVTEAKNNGLEYEAPDKVSNICFQTLKNKYHLCGEDLL